MTQEINNEYIILFSNLNPVRLSDRIIKTQQYINVVFPEKWCRL